MSGDLTARDAVAHEVLPGIVVDGKLAPDYEGADVLLAALAAAGWRLVRDDQWEWGVRFPDGEVGYTRGGYSEGWVKDYVQTAHSNGHLGHAAVRRLVQRGEWEVAPDA